MNLEHLALQVEDPAGFARWYAANLGFSVRRTGGEPSHVHFLATSDGAILLEIYRNPKVPAPDYRKMDPLLLHLAFTCTTIPATIDRLTAAGATVASPRVVNAAGDEIAMLRDPWGLAIQFVNRSAAIR